MGSTDVLCLNYSEKPQDGDVTSHQGVLTRCLGTPGAHVHSSGSEGGVEVGAGVRKQQNCYLRSPGESFDKLVCPEDSSACRKRFSPSFFLSKWRKLDRDAVLVPCLPPDAPSLHAS